MNEEDIKNIEYSLLINNGFNGMGLVDIPTLKKLYEKYKELEEYYKEQNEVNAKFIPKSKVEEKIEELNKKLNNGGKTYGRYGGCVINSENIMKLQNQIQVLEELLQEGE